MELVLQGTSHRASKDLLALAHGPAAKRTALLVAVLGVSQDWWYHLGVPIIRIVVYWVDIVVPLFMETTT